LHPATILVCLLPSLKDIIQAGMPILFAVLSSSRGNRIELGLAFLGLLGGLGSIANFWTTRFGISEGHLVWHTGWIFRRDRRIPLDQIQNVNLRQNLLERLLRVATVEVESAAGSGAEMQLKVLGLPAAESFRQELMALLVQVKDPAPAQDALVCLSATDLLLGRLSENHWMQVLLSSFLGGSLIAAFSFAFQHEWIFRTPRELIALLAFGGLVLLAMGGWGLGAATYILKWGRFEVRREGAFDRVSYGLVNRVQLSIRPSRIEYVELVRTIPQRWLSRSTLYVGTAGSFGEAGILAPIGLMMTQRTADAAVRTIVPGLDIGTLPWSPFPSVYYRSLVAKFLLTSAGAILIERLAHLAEFEPLVWTVRGMIAPFYLAYAATVVTHLLARSESGYALTDQALALRFGYYQQRVRVIPVERLELVSTTQPPWWRKQSVVQVTVRGMVHAIPIPAAFQSLAQDLRAEMAR